MRAYIGLIGLLIIMVFIAACGDESGREATRPGGPGTTAIFPLAVGNTWVFDDASESDSISAEVVEDGTTYYVLDGFLGEPISVRMNDQQQLVVRREDGSCGDYVLFDFGAEPGDRWPLFAPCGDTLHSDHMVFHQRVDSVTVPAGTYRDCFEFILDASITDWGMDWIVAPGVGVVSFSHVALAGSRTYELVEFIEAEE